MTTTTATLTYQGPREVLINQPVVLSGTFDPQKVVKVTFVAEDKFPLNVVIAVQSGTWQVKLDKGFNLAGARWLRLKGLDRTGKAVGEKVIYITVSTDPVTVGQALTLKVLQDTFFKVSPADSSKLSEPQKVAVKAGQTFKVSKYGFTEGHLKVSIAPVIAPIGEFGYFFAKHVQLSKGSKVFSFNIADVPNIPLQGQVLITRTTLIKAKVADSATLAADQKFELLQGQSFAITGYACMEGHFRVTLAEAIPEFGNSGFIFWEHLQLKKDGKVIAYNPDALTVTALRTTVFKKRPLDSSQLSNAEKVTLPGGTVYGVGSYALADGQLKVAMTDDFAGFGNTGYLFPDHIQLKRGGQSFNPFPPQVELNVPYFSQRDNPRLYWSTCNVTSIAMVLYYYGLRARSGGQLEDELLQWCLNHYGQGSQTDNGALSELIKAYGFKTSFSTTRRWSQVKDELANGRPVVMGGLFTHGGHIVTVVGYTPQGYIVNDPWGDALSGYYNTEGKKLLYPYSYMDRVAGPDGGVWAHFVAKS